MTGRMKIFWQLCSPLKKRHHSSVHATRRLTTVASFHPKTQLSCENKGNHRLCYMAHTFTFRVRMSLWLPRNLRPRGITRWEHGKPVNLENNTAVIHVSITPLNIKHLFATDFPAFSHCIIADTWSERSASAKMPKTRHDSVPPSTPGCNPSALAILSSSEY